MPYRYVIFAKMDLDVQETRSRMREKARSLEERDHQIILSLPRNLYPESQANFPRKQCFTSIGIGMVSVSTSGQIGTNGDSFFTITHVLEWGSGIWISPTFPLQVKKKRREPVLRKEKRGAHTMDGPPTCKTRLLTLLEEAQQFVPFASSEECDLLLVEVIKFTAKAHKQRLTFEISMESLVEQTRHGKMTKGAAAALSESDDE